MRILVFHMRYAPDATGTGPLVTELAQGLAERGNEVTVVASAPHYGRTRVPKPYRRGWLHTSTEQGVRVVRTAAVAWGSEAVLGRAIDYGLYAVLSAWAGLRAPHPDVVLCIAPPITVGLTGWLISRFHDVPMAFNAQDIWPDGLIAMGRLRSRVGIRLLRAMESWVYRRSQSISVLSAGMADNIASKGVPLAKVVVLPNWVDLNAVRPVQKANRFRRELGLGDDFVVLFAGNLGYAAGLETVLDAAVLLRNEPGLAFVVVGEGSAKRSLIGRATDLALANVHFVPTQASDFLAEVYGAADLSLVTLRRGMGAVSVPSKAYAIMASGRPMLAAVPEDSEVRRLVEIAGCGVWVGAEDAGALADAIRRLRGDRSRLEEFGAHGRHWVETHHKKADLISRYHHWLVEIAASRSPKRPSSL